MSITKVTFRVNIGGEEKILTEAKLGPYASFLGLDRIAPGRYSWAFVADLYLNEHLQGVDPTMVIEELKDMEAGRSTTGTKPASEFTRPPLKGLWHKHYFSAHFVPTNILNHLSGDKMMKLAEHVFDRTVSPVCTEEMLRQFAHEISHGSLEQRTSANKLTGEWIVFAKHVGQNYYLRTTTHNHGDQALYDSIRSTSLREFPFLQL